MKLRDFEGSGSCVPVRLCAVDHPVRRRQPRRYQQELRLRRGRSHSRASRHPDARLLPPARLGRTVRRGLNRGAAHRTGCRTREWTGRDAAIDRRGAARVQGPPDRSPRLRDADRRGHQSADHGRRRRSIPYASWPTSKARSIERKPNARIVSSSSRAIQAPGCPDL